MALFPMFVDLTGRDVLILGTGADAEDKAARLAPFGCRIIRQETEGFDGLSEPLPALVVLADRHHPANAGIAALCRSMRVPVNAVDDPPLCDIPFPSMVCRGDLTVAVSTHGKAPAVGQLIRAGVESALPDSTGEILQWASMLTLRLRASIPDAKTRGAVLRRLIARAFELGRPLTDAECETE